MSKSERLPNEHEPRTRKRRIEEERLRDVPLPPRSQLHITPDELVAAVLFSELENPERHETNGWCPYAGYMHDHGADPDYIVLESTGLVYLGEDSDNADNDEGV